MPRGAGGMGLGFRVQGGVSKQAGAGGARRERPSVDRSVCHLCIGAGAGRGGGAQPWTWGEAEAGM